MGAAFPAVNPTRWWTVTGMRVCWVGAPRSDPEPPMPRRRFRRTHPISDLRQIAWLQKFLILVLIGQLFLWLGFIAVMVLGLDTPGEDDIPLQLTLGLSVVMGLAGAVLVILIGVKVSGPATGVLLGILTAIPCLGLLMLLIVNTQATGLLQRNGVRVGLLGARLTDIAELPEELDEEDEDEDEYEDRRRRRSSEINEDEGW